MRIRSKTFITFIILAVIYASVNLLAAPSRTSLQQYHVSSSTMRVLNSTVVLPVIGIWFMGLYGYQKLRRYTTYIQDNDEGKRLVELTRGVMLLAWWLPVTSTVSAVLNLSARWHPEFAATAVIIIDYLAMLFPLAAFWFISRGSRNLSDLSRKRPSQMSIHLMSLSLIAGSTAYSYLVANSHEELWSIYHMPAWVVMLTLVVPYIFTWYLGLLAAFDIRLYTSTVKGVIFRRSWNRVAFGVVWIIATSILLQYVTTVSARLGDTPLGLTLFLIYGTLSAMAVGYLYIALGAKALTKIEEV